MDFLINVSFHQPANQQAEAVLDTVGKAIQYQDYKERLTPYAIGVRQQFTEPPIDLTNHLRDTLKSAEFSFSFCYSPCNPVSGAVKKVSIKRYKIQSFFLPRSFLFSSSRKFNSLIKPS